MCAFFIDRIISPAHHLRVDSGGVLFESCTCKMVLAIIVCMHSVNIENSLFLVFKIHVADCLSFLWAVL
jgi:hypothetical protein